MVRAPTRTAIQSAQLDIPRCSYNSLQMSCIVFHKVETTHYYVKITRKNEYFGLLFLEDHFRTVSQFICHINCFSKRISRYRKSNFSIFNTFTRKMSSGLEASNWFAFRLRRKFDSDVKAYLPISVNEMNKSRQAYR